MQQSFCSAVGRFQMLAITAGALFSALTLTSHAQIGTGWTEYTATKKIHLDNESGLQIYNWTSYKSVGNPICADYRFDSSTGIETFRLLNNASNRAEIRLENNYTTGRNQFQGEIRLNTPTDDESVHQVFGGVTHATAMQVRAFSDSNGTLKDTTSGDVLATGVYGVWIRVNTIHDADTGELWAYANGTLKSHHSDNGEATHYNKYGCYGTLRTPSAKVEWRNIHIYRGGSPTVPDANSFEAETLSRTSSGASTQVETDSNASGGQWISLLADGVGDNVQYTVPNVAAGIYTVKMQYKAHPNRGILQMAVNGTNLGGTLDQYSATPQWLENTFGVVNFPTAGNKTIRLSVVGKNASAGTFNLSADQFTLEPGQEGGAFEAEGLAVENSSGDTVRTLDETAASGGVTLMNDSNAVGDFVTLRIPSISAGSYSVKVRFKMHPSRGIVQVQIGKIGGSLGDIGMPIDLYSATPAYQEFVIDEWGPGSTSDKQISFKIVGKNPNSSGFTQCIDRITLEPQ